MAERISTHDTYDSENAMTIRLSNNEMFEVSPHNTALFEFTGAAASRNHIFFYVSTDSGNLEPVYLFRTFDPKTYDDIRQQILDDPEYEVAVSDEIAPCEERAYQRQVDLQVEEWRRNIPNTAIDFLIKTSR